MDLKECENRFAILDLMARYTLAVDAHDPEGWAATFTEDGIFQNETTQIIGREKIAAYARIHAKLGTRHITASPLFTITEDGLGAHGQCTTVVTVATQKGYRVIMTGLYRDTLVKQNGEWLIQRRCADAQPLSDDPHYPVLTSDPDTREYVTILLDAWKDLSVPV
ncbi:MAG: nuclear transport factor 2 family protein [Alphaproteobacteria bacterium]|nr:nuclear transport factor 2 family protein [Alphaproteobacteria bacterium]